MALGMMSGMTHSLEMLGMVLVVTTGMTYHPQHSRMIFGDGAGDDMSSPNFTDDIRDNVSDDVGDDVRDD